MTRPTLHTLSPEAARQLRQILARPAPGRPPEFRFPVGLEVRVVRAGAEAGTSPRVYHEGMLRDIRGLETGDHEDAGTEFVYLADLGGGSLTEDDDYLAIRGGEWPDAEDVPRPLYWCHSGGGGGVWMARLTTKHATHSRWKYVRQKLTAATPPVWADDGAESADYTAVPSTIDGTDLANPVAGLRVVMWESAARAGYQEFLPIGYADATHPGLVSTGAQEFLGGKTFLNTIDSLEDITAAGALTGATLAVGSPDLQYPTDAPGLLGVAASTKALTLTDTGGRVAYLYPDSSSGAATLNVVGVVHSRKSTSALGAVTNAPGFAVDGSFGINFTEDVYDSDGNPWYTKVYKGGILISVTYA
jgi:hypothetical protein